MSLNFGNKVENQGATSQGKITAAEFNAVISNLNNLLAKAEKEWYGTEQAYLALKNANQLHNDWNYYILENSEGGNNVSCSVSNNTLTIGGICTLSQDGKTLVIPGVWALSQDGKTLTMTNN